MNRFAGIVLVLASPFACAAVAAQAPAESSEKKGWLHDPPGFLTYVALIGNVGLFFWGFYQWRVGRKDRTEDRHGAINQFWCESVLVPQLLAPVVDFLNDQLNRLKALEVAPTVPGALEKYTAYLELYDVRFNELAARLSLLSAFSRPHHGVVIASLEKLDDAVNLLCHERSERKAPSSQYRIDLHFADTQAECVDAFRRMHFEAAGL